VDDIIVPLRVADAAATHAAPAEAFRALSQTLARAPEVAIQRLAELAMRMTGADSAGVSLEDTEDGEPVFRWIAAAGEFQRYLRGTMPRNFSPCGEVLHRRKALLMRDPARHYPYIAQLHAPICSALLAPFSRDGKPVGTVWVLAHSPDKSFTTDDVAAVQNLTTFATTILDALASRRGQAALHDRIP
jgi:GAF domain-containing protein